MFTWIGSQIDGVLSTYVLGVVTSLMAALTPVALSAMTLWVALYGWAVLRNEVSETLPAFIWKAFKTALVLTFALQSSVYISNVADTANALATGVATTFLPSMANPAAVTGPYALLDAFNEEASRLVVDLLKAAGFTRLDLWFAAIVTALGNVVFLCVALFIVSLAKVLLAFTIAVGPIFILCLVWRPTARLFDSWLSMVLNVVVLTWFAFFALGFSAHVGQSIIEAVQSQGGFSGPTFNPVAESLSYCIVMILMAIICFQAPNLASALTGGVAVQQGIQMIQNALMVTRLRSSPRSAVNGALGGTVRAGAGMAYAAGHATGAAAQAARNFASGAMGARSPHANGSQVPAYKRAAMHGRSSKQ